MDTRTGTASASTSPLGSVGPGAGGPTGDGERVYNVLELIEQGMRQLQTIVNTQGASERQGEKPASGKVISLPVLSDRATPDPVPQDHKFLHTVIEALNYPFMVINVADSTISIANAAARACGPEGARHCYALTHHRDTPCDSVEHPCPVQLVKQSGKPVCVEHVHFDRAGRPRNVEVHGYPVFDDQGRFVQMIEYSVDITERKRAEAALLETRDLMVFAMAKLTESRDPETGAHLERMREYSMILTRELSERGPYTAQIDAGFLESMYRAAPLHDIGKVGIPDNILLKSGHLSTTEFEIMKQHAVLGAEALDKIVAATQHAGFLTMAAQIARSHHERYNGKGYPQGISGTEIPLAARIVAVADVFDALSSARVYKPAFEPHAAKMMIEAESGKHFDPAIVTAFTSRWEEIFQVYKRLGHGATSDAQPALHLTKAA